MLKLTKYLKNNFINYPDQTLLQLWYNVIAMVRFCSLNLFLKASDKCHVIDRSNLLHLTMKWWSSKRDRVACTDAVEHTSVWILVGLVEKCLYFFNIYLFHLSVTNGLGHFSFFFNVISMRNLKIGFALFEEMRRISDNCCASLFSWY